MRGIILFVLIFIVSSCGIIMINENGYRNLNEHQKFVIKPFNEDLIFNYTPVSFQSFIYEINTSDIKSVLSNQKYTWIHLWRPFCKGETCKNLSFYSNLENKFMNNDFKLLFISETYDLNIIKNKVKENYFKKPVFVLQDSYFGHKSTKIREKLSEELNNSINIKNQKYGFDDFLFKDTLLIYAGRNINKHIIDSLISR